MAKVYWLSEAEWACIEPLMPRGRRGAHRVDDRRIISGIVHMLRSGGRWRDCPAVYGPYTTVYNRFNRWSRQGLWLEIFEALTGQNPIPRPGHDRQHSHQGPPFSRRRKRGAYFQAIGQSRGGRTSKLHALSDGSGRPLALLLTAGNINDISIARALLHRVGPVRRLIADRGYDANHLRRFLADQQAEAIIPSTTSRRKPIPYDTIAYRDRNRIERMWCRLKDWRRIATRYDKLARNYLSGAHLAAVLACWAN